MRESFYVEFYYSDSGLCMFSSTVTRLLATEGCSSTAEYSFWMY